MIKIPNLEHLKVIKKAQNNVGKHSNYLIDVLKPAIEHGDWDRLEQLDIGFDINGKSLGKIIDNEAWKKLQQFLIPNASTAHTLDFSLDGKIIERNLINELKSLILKMMWISPKENSFATLYHTLNELKKFIKPLLLEGVNSFSHIDINVLEKWELEGLTQLNFRRESIYSSLNKLFIEQDGLSFNIALTSRLTASDFNLNLIKREQYPVIPQRLYYRALCEAESLISHLYPMRDDIGKLSSYLVNFQDNIYAGYVKYIHQGIRVKPNGELSWRLENSNKNGRIKNNLFKEAISMIISPTLAQILNLMVQYQPVIKESFYDKCYPDRYIKLGNEAISNQSQAEQLLTKYSGVCTWALMAKSGMRGDEIYDLHTVNGCTTVVIARQTIYLLNADLDKTVKGIQSKQDEFVSTKLSMKAYEILQAIHTPLRLSNNSKRFFHKFRDGFGAVMKKSVSRKAKNWFESTLKSELSLTNDDIKDLKLSDPERSFDVGDDYQFTCHQLRRSFAYYLIGYELLSFPQLKQQFSHVSLGMSRHYANNASKFQKLRTQKGKVKNLCTEVDDERVRQKAQIYLNIYNQFANKERVAGGKGKEFSKRMMVQGTNAFKDKVNNDMLTIEYWENIMRKGKRHLHVVAPGIYCTSQNCSLRTQVSLIECVDCDNDYIVDAVYAEAMRKEAETHMYFDIEHNELTPQTASESYIKITAAQRIMDDLGVEYVPVKFPKAVKDLLIPQIGVTR
ncbi:site-specific integrase [Colwellia sp. 20A7]|uniref:site-specific integrase n=1 Tax=Colwellia sp. 20A7 TaxID=2689569 RepID=UPI0013578EAA|nr:site-specific integrase [Colwellia sp. 20A7]